MPRLEAEVAAFQGAADADGQARAAGAGDLLPCRRRLGADPGRAGEADRGRHRAHGSAHGAGRAGGRARDRERRTAAAGRDQAARPGGDRRSAAGRPAAAGIPDRQDRHPAAGGAAAADHPAAREEAGAQARAAQAGADAGRRRRCRRRPSTASRSRRRRLPAAAPRVVSASQLGFLVPPNPIYPARSRKAGEQGTVMVRVLVDVAGRPAQVIAGDVVGPSGARRGGVERRARRAVPALFRRRRRADGVGAACRSILCCSRSRSWVTHPPWASAISSRSPTSSPRCCWRCW